MKKLALLLAIPALLVACGGETEKEEGKKDDKKKSEKSNDEDASKVDESSETKKVTSFDPNEAADDYCACAELVDQEQTDCHQAWADKYKAPMTDGTASRSQGEQLGKRMAECDPDNAMKVLKMLM